jgi:hypothetical protein
VASLLLASRTQLLCERLDVSEDGPHLSFLCAVSTTKERCSTGARGPAQAAAAAADHPAERGGAQATKAAVERCGRLSSSRLQPLERMNWQPNIVPILDHTWAVSEHNSPV